MSSSYAGPSSEVTETHPTSSGLRTTQTDKSGPSGEDRPQPGSPLNGSPKPQDHGSYSPSNGLDLPAVQVTTRREPGPTEIIQDPEQQEDRPLYPYINIWRKNFVLTLGMFIALPISFSLLTHRRRWRGTRILATNHSEGVDGKSGRTRAQTGQRRRHSNGIQLSSHFTRRSCPEETLAP